MVEELTSTSEGMRLFQQEKLILDCTELICELMAEQGISKAKLAEKLGRSKGYITQLLDGRANMTLRTVSDVMWALDSAVHITPVALDIGTNWSDEGKVMDWPEIWPEPEQESGNVRYKTRRVIGFSKDVSEKWQKVVA